jgi:hypothetical protein
MQQVAGEIGIDYEKNDTFHLKKQLSNFKYFSESLLSSHYSTIQNIVAGALHHVDVYLFDHQYRTGGENSRTYQQTVFVANLNDLKIPGFRFQYDCWYQMKLINRHRMPSGQVVYQEELMVHNETEESVREKFPPAMQSLLSAVNPANIECQKGYLMIYRPKTLMGTEDAISFFYDCCDFVTMLQSKQTRKIIYEWAEIEGKYY